MQHSLTTGCAPRPRSESRCWQSRILDRLAPTSGVRSPLLASGPPVPKLLTPPGHLEVLDCALAWCAMLLGCSRCGCCRGHPREEFLRQVLQLAFLWAVVAGAEEFAQKNNTCLAKNATTFLSRPTRGRSTASSKCRKATISYLVTIATTAGIRATGDTFRTRIWLGKRSLYG